MPAWAPAISAALSAFFVPPRPRGLPLPVPDPRGRPRPRVLGVGGAAGLGEGSSTIRRPSLLLSSWVLRADSVVLRLALEPRPEVKVGVSWPVTDMGPTASLPTDTCMEQQTARSTLIIATTEMCYLKKQFFHNNKLINLSLDYIA